MSHGKLSVQGLTEKRYDSHSSDRRLLEKPSQRKANRGEKAGISSCTRYPRASYFEKARNVCQKFLVCMYDVVSRVHTKGKNGMRNNRSPAQPRKVHKKLVSSNVAKKLEKRK
jgi:hypothetical protein